MTFKVKDDIPFALPCSGSITNILWMYGSINDKPQSQTVDCIDIKTSFSLAMFYYGF